MRPNFMLSADAAAAIGIRPQTLRKWRTQGRGPRHTHIGGRAHGWISYDSKDVEKWIEAERAKAQQ